MVPWRKLSCLNLLPAPSWAFSLKSAFSGQPLVSCHHHDPSFLHLPYLLILTLDLLLQLNRLLNFVHLIVAQTPVLEQVGLLPEQQRRQVHFQLTWPLSLPFLGGTYRTNHHVRPVTHHSCPRRILYHLQSMQLNGVLHLKLSPTCHVGIIPWLAKEYACFAHAQYLIVRGCSVPIPIINLSYLQGNSCSSHRKYL